MIAVLFLFLVVRWYDRRVGWADGDEDQAQEHQDAVDLLVGSVHQHIVTSHPDIEDEESL